MSETNDNNNDEEHQRGPAPKEEWDLIFQGAEAKLWKLQWYETSHIPVVCKERFSKSYRHPELDARLVKSRCRSEAKMLDKCRKGNLSVPKVIRVDPPLLYMEYLSNCMPLKQALLENKILRNMLALQLGSLVASLHSLGIVHGDLTTSNIMVEIEIDESRVVDDDKSPPRKRQKEEEEKNSNKISDIPHENDFWLTLIDFGLAKATYSVEEQAVDLYVLERALQSTHPDLPEPFFDEWLLPCYERIMASEMEIGGKNKNSKKTGETAVQRLEQVRKRGRKRECFG